jgi:hypothetical protein
MREEPLETIASDGRARGDATALVVVGDGILRVVPFSGEALVVTLDGGDTEPVGDGCDTAVGAASFTAPLTPPPMNKAGAGAPRRGLKAVYAERRAR